VVYNFRYYRVSRTLPSSDILKNGLFQKLDHRTETDQFPKCCALSIMDDGQDKFKKTSNPK
jgi:hypothetical protein